MKLALLGADEHCLPLIRAAVASPEHEIAVICLPEIAGEALLRHCPVAEWEDDWENLLLGGRFDAVIVGRRKGDADLRVEQLRRLVQEGVPLLAVHPAAEAIVMHELDMIRADTRSPLAAYIPGRLQPALAAFAAYLGRGEESPLGNVSQVLFERSLTDGQPSSVLAQFACDVELLRAIAGPLNRVSALRPPGQEDSLINLAVNLAGESQRLIRWSAKPSPNSGASITLVGGNRQTRLAIPADGEAWKLESFGDQANVADKLETCDDAAATLDMFARHIAGEPAIPTWIEACQAAELAEAVEESLRRGRTIQLHFEQHSEQQTFKSVMAAGGCLLLVGVLLFVLANVMIDALDLPFRHAFLWRIWPIYVFVPVVLFLLLQTLWRVFSNDVRSG